VSHPDGTRAVIDHPGHVDTQVFGCKVHPTSVSPTR
jgi:hypothetical protein